MLSFTQLRMLGRHMGYRAMVLANLYSISHRRHSGRVTVRIKHSGQLARHLRYGFFFLYQRGHVFHESFEAGFGKAPDRLRPARFTQCGERFRRELIVGVPKLGSALIREAEMLGGTTTAHRLPGAGWRAAVYNLGESFLHQNV